MKTPIVLIAAVARNGAIGLRNGFPWHLPADMRRFRERTMGKPLILGRRTWQSIGRALPGRALVVLSSDPHLPLPDDAMLCRDLDDAVSKAETIAEAWGAGEVMVGGGAEVYAGLIGRADRLEITEVDLAPEADAFFPSIDAATWRVVSRAPQPPAPDAGFAFVTYERRRSLGR